MRRISALGLATWAIVAMAASGSEAQPYTAPSTYGVKTMSFDLWCQETQKLPVERCRQRRAEDLKAFNDYREVVERYELQYLKQVQRDRDTAEMGSRDINSTVLDKSIGTR